MSTDFNSYDIGTVNDIYTINTIIARNPNTLPGENGREDHYLDLGILKHEVKEAEGLELVTEDKLTIKVDGIDYTAIFYDGGTQWSDNPEILGNCSTMMAFINPEGRPVMDKTQIKPIADIVEQAIHLINVDSVKYMRTPVYGTTL